MVFVLVGAFLVGVGTGAMIVLGSINSRVTALEKKQTLLSQRIDDVAQLAIERRTVFVEKEDRVLAKKVSELEKLVSTLDTSVRALLSGNSARSGGTVFELSNPIAGGTVSHINTVFSAYPSGPEHAIANPDTVTHQTYYHTLRECCDAHTSLTGSGAGWDDCPSWVVLEQLCNSLWSADKMRSFYRGVSGAELHSGHAQQDAGEQVEGDSAPGGDMESPG